MSKKKSKTYNYTISQKLPKLGKIKTEWDLKNLYYTSEKDPRIEKDIAKAERAYMAFEKKYRGRKFTTSPKVLARALSEYETLTSMRESRSPLYYFEFRVTKDAHDTVAQKRLNLIEDRLTRAGNKILFFEIALGKIPRKNQKTFLASPLLKSYRYFLTRIFLESKHILSEPEERILSLKSDVSFGLWVQGTEKILNKRSIQYKGESIPLPSAVDRVDTLPAREKIKLWKCITDEFQNLAEIAENEINAIVTNKKIHDELRGYTSPYTATIQAYENDEKAVLALVESITTKGFALSRKYYKLKARQAGVRVLPYSNRNDVYGDEPSVSFSTAVDVCRDTFYGLDKDYGAILDDMLRTGCLDVYPTYGKGGGAFCAGDINLPTLVMLNQVDSFRSLSTLAHEMGHAIHTEMSKTQPSFYQRYSTTTAETASTFFEGLVQQRVIERLPDSQKITLLSRKIGEAIATICRQVAFFNYERELHERIRNEGAMTADEMATLLQKHLQSYLGPAVTVSKEDGLSFVYIGHFRRFFYVYSYAYGELMSNCMIQKLNQDVSYKSNIKNFLMAGGSDAVENIFSSIGINALKSTTFLDSLKTLELDITAFEKLLK